MASGLSRVYCAPPTLVHIDDPVAYPLPSGYVMYTPAQLSRMWEEFERRLAQAKADADRSGTLQKNFDFHFLLYEAAGMPILLGLLETLWARTGPSLRELYRPPFFHMAGEHPHLALLRALRSRDAPAALASIQQDVAGHGEALMQRLAQPSVS